MIYWQLFLSFVQIGLFSFGGGYAAIPLIQNQVVDIHGWLTMKEFADVITISQMTPGPIGINAATFIGIRMGGILGAVVATIGCILPSCIIVLTLAYFYQRFRKLSAVQGVLQGLRPAVIAMITSAGLELLILSFWREKGISLNYKGIDFIAVGIFLVAFTIIRKWKVSPILLMLGSGISGFVLYSFFAK